MMGPYFQQPRNKINQKAQGKKKLAGGGPYVPPSRHLVVKATRRYKGRGGECGQSRESPDVFVNLRVRPFLCRY